MQNFKLNSVIWIKHSRSLIFTNINKNIRRDEFTVLSFELPMFSEWRAIPVRIQPSIECRWVAALQKSDYVGSASNCVGGVSRTMAADSLLTPYSVYPVNSFPLPHVASRQSPQNGSSNLCFSPLLATLQLWQELLLGLEAFPPPNTWKPSASVRSSKAQLVQRPRMGTTFFCPPAKLKVLQRTSAQRGAVEAYGTILYRCIPGGCYKNEPECPTSSKTADPSRTVKHFFLPPLK